MFGLIVCTRMALRKLKEDNRISLRIHSIDGVNITESFWERAGENEHSYYSEIIISGEIL